MKKILMIVAVMALVSMSSFAQTFGVKAGVNFANGSGDDFEDTDARTGMVFGGFAKFELSEKFAFQPELLYSMQGAKESGDGWDETWKMDYLNIPLMAKYYVAEGFSINAGPQVGFLLSAKAEWEEDGESGDVDIKDELKGTDFGFNFGVGYELESGLGFDLRYNLGLSDVGDHEEADGKHRVFQITASYAF